MDGALCPLGTERTAPGDRDRSSPEPRARTRQPGQRTQKRGFPAVSPDQSRAPVFKQARSWLCRQEDKRRHKSRSRGGFTVDLHRGRRGSRSGPSSPVQLVRLPARRNLCIATDALTPPTDKPPYSQTPFSRRTLLQPSRHTIERTNISRRTDHKLRHPPSARSTSAAVRPVSAARRRSKALAQGPPRQVVRRFASGSACFKASTSPPRRPPISCH